jgi:L-amino acid N-acyltransferase YncA
MPTLARRRSVEQTSATRGPELGDDGAACDEYRLAGMRIRPARPEDADEIARIHVRAWQAAYADILARDALEGLSVADRAERWRALLGDPQPGHRAWVAEDGGGIVGFSSTGPSRDPDSTPGTAEVFTIYLAPEVIGTGRGRELFARAVDDLRVQGYRAAELWVLTANDRSRRFYERAGWRTDGEEKVESLFEIEVRETRYRIEL